jgi:hypothetical protein
VAIGGKNASIDLVQVANGSLLCSLPLAESLHSTSSIRALAFAHNSKYLASSIGSPIQFWDLKTKQIKSLFIGHRSPIAALTFTNSGSVYAADEAGVIKLWSYKSPEQSMQDLIDPSAAHTSAPMQPHCMQLSHIGTSLAVGFCDGYLRIWDSNTGKMVRKHRYHSTKLSGISWSPRKPSLLTTSGMDEKLYLIDTLQESSKIADVVDVKERLTCVSAHENGYHIAAGSVAGNIYLFDWRKPSFPIAKFEGHSPHAVNALAFQVVRSLPRSEHGSEASGRSSRAGTMGDIDTVKRSNNVAPATSIISLNNKPPTPPDDRGDLSRSSTPSRLSTSAISNSAMSNNQRIESSPDLEYRKNMILLDKEKRTSTDSNSNQLHTVIPTTQKATLNSKSGSYFGSSHNNPEILQKVNSMITEYEKTLRPIAALESPRASQAPSRNRYAAAEASIEEPSIPPISRHEKTAGEAPTTDKTNTVVHSKPLDPIQFRNEIMQIEKQVKEEDQLYREGVAANAQNTEATSLVSTVNHSSEKIDLENESKSGVNRESFASKYAARAKVISDVGGYANSFMASPAVETMKQSVPPRSSGHRDYMRDEDESIDKTISPIKEDFSSLRNAVRPVTAKELEEALELLKYDIHREIQEVIREQVRQFSIAKVNCKFVFTIYELDFYILYIYHYSQEDTMHLIRDLSLQLKELLIANKELRDENERLRKIY